MVLKLFNQDITIVNKRFNKSTKENEYIINHIKGFWSSSNGISISGTNLIKNDELIVRILMSEPGYIDSKEFQKGNQGWTLQEDDYLIKGIVEEVSTIAEMKDNYECMKIVKFAKKDYGSIDMHHFEIQGE